MNERIKDIIGQNCVSEYYAGTLCWRFSEIQLEKFAELIVQECAQVCLAQRDPANLNYKPSVKFAEAINQHFGVEE